MEAATGVGLGKLAKRAGGREVRRCRIERESMHRRQALTWCVMYLSIPLVYRSAERLKLSRQREETGEIVSSAISTRVDMYLAIALEAI